MLRDVEQRISPLEPPVPQRLKLNAPATMLVFGCMMLAALEQLLQCLLQLIIHIPWNSTIHKTRTKLRSAKQHYLLDSVPEVGGFNPSCQYEVVKDHTEGSEPKCSNSSIGHGCSHDP